MQNEIKKETVAVKSLEWHERAANNTNKEIKPQSLLQGFLTQVQNNAEKTALFCDSDIKNSFSYKETAERTACIANELKKAGVKPQERVAVSVPRGKDLVCAILGVLWAGGVYVPINHSQPLQRRRDICSQADIGYCLTNSNVLAADFDGCKNIFLDKLIQSNEELPEPYIADPEESAYIIFTSGSTGKPKGVEISHHAAWNTIADILERFDFSSEDCVLNVSAADFDLSVFDIFGLLSVGGEVVLLSDEIQKEAQQWIRLVKERKVTVWNSVPALFEMLLVSLAENEYLEGMRLAMLSGDWVMPNLYELMKKHTVNSRFVALGGATEAAIWSNYYEVTSINPEWHSVPYGKPLSNQQFRVVSNGIDAVTGEVGELWIGGNGLAKQYVGAPDLTAASFVYDKGKRWYKTGDLGYYLFDDNICFVGRRDNQIKINGFRIELGEIESKLSSLNDIRRSVALVNKEDSKSTIVAVLELDEPKLQNDKTEIKNEVFYESQLSERDYIVADFIRKVMYNENIPVFLKENLSAESKSIIALWENYLSKFNMDLKEFHISKDNKLFEDALNERINLFRRIITGEISPLVLLDDPILAPSKLLFSEGTPELMKIFAQKIKDRFAELNEANVNKSTFTVALLYGRQGDIYVPLLEGLSNNTTDFKFLYIESSDAMLSSARKKLDRYGFEIEYIKTDGLSIPAVFAGSVDIALSLNSLHLFRNVNEGLMWLRAFLKKDGCLFAAESSCLSSVGLISAAVIEKGFCYYTDERRLLGSPMLPPSVWVDKINASGYIGAEFKQYRDEDLFIITAHNSKSNVLKNYAELKEYCSEKLVSYMIPEQIIYTVKLPLTENGKIDRKTILTWFSSAEKHVGALPQTETEKKLAEIWCELLNKDTVYSEDNFFEIGGDSLMATRMLAALRNSLGIHISMREAFDSPTLCKIAKIVDERIGEVELEEGEL